MKPHGWLLAALALLAAPLSAAEPAAKIRVLLTYGGYYVAPGVHVLLKTSHPKNTPELAWTTRYAASPVVYLMLGHDGQAYANSSYRELVARSIRFVARK